MGNRDRISQKDNVMKDIKDSVGDDSSQVRSDGHCQKEAKDDISRNHDFAGKFGTKGIISITAIDPKEHEENDNGTKEHKDEGISNGNVTFQHFIEGYDIIEDGGRGLGNDEATHCDREHAELEQDSVHCTEFKGRDTNFPAVARRHFGDLLFLAIKF